MGSREFIFATHWVSIHFWLTKNKPLSVAWNLPAVRYFGACGVVGNMPRRALACRRVVLKKKKSHHWCDHGIFGSVWRRLPQVPVEWNLQMRSDRCPFSKWFVISLQMDGDKLLVLMPMLS